MPETVKVERYDGVPGNPHECVNARGGGRCDICFGPIRVIRNFKPDDPDRRAT